MTNSGLILLTFLPFRSGRNPPRCSRYSVYVTPKLASALAAEEELLLF